MTAETKRRKRLETTLAAAVAHPIRCRCLGILAEREASPVEISKILGLDVSKVGYHVTNLAEANLIEETRNRPVRGAVEHFYRATQLPIVEADGVAGYTPAEHRNALEAVLSIFAANASHAIETGVLQQRPDHHLTRFVFNMDEQGWIESTAAHMDLYERVFEIHESAANRMAESGEAPLRGLSFLGFFEVPKSDA